jgi:pimeloyl-ACP methyl ester carboxylesterase
MLISAVRRAIAGASIVAALAVPQASFVAAADAPKAYGEIVSHQPYKISQEIHGKAELIIHDMPSVTGDMTEASTLLFVPDGKAPTGGWPVIAWAHGTTTPGNKTCAPSLTMDLDGGLTRDGFKSDYLYEVATLVNAGYAVVAPDFEGLGDIAEVPLPYFNASSLARSLISGVIAAHDINGQLSRKYVSVGHSDGGHAVLGVEAFTKEAPQFDYLGTVAIAPYTAIAATVDELARKAKNTPAEAANFTALANFHVGLMATGLSVIDHSFDPASIMGKDLASLVGGFKTLCSVPAITSVTAAVKAKGEAFEGYKQNWAASPGMSDFLERNDVAVDPTFRLAKPTLIIVGTKDPFIFNDLTEQLVKLLETAGTPVTYKEYPYKDHFDVIRSSQPDIMAFLKERFAN